MTPRWSLLLSLGFSLVLGIGTLFSPPHSRAVEPPKAGPTQGRLEGRFTAADTGKPVAGATLRVLIDGVPGKNRIAEIVSGVDGGYALDVPLGHISLFGLYAPPGYLTQDDRTYSAVLTTAAQPKAVRDFKLQPGAAWRVEVLGAEIPAEKRPYFSALPDPVANPNGYPSSAAVMQSVSDARGKSVLTVASPARYRFTCNFMTIPSRYELPYADIELDQDFEPRKIKGAPESHPERRGAVRLRDTAGRVAVVDGGEVLVEDGQAVIRFRASSVPTEEALILRGKAVDERGKPIEGVKFTAAFVSNRGGGMSNYEVMTNREGLFELKDLRLPLTSFQPDARVQMIAIKPGYEGAQTEDLSLMEVKKTGSGDFGTVILKPGHTLRGKVIDEKGHPVQGAVVTNSTNFFLYSHLSCRTDAEGNFAMPDLPYGWHKLWTSYGELIGEGGCAFDATSGKSVIELRLHSKPVVRGMPGLPVPRR